MTRLSVSMMNGNAFLAASGISIGEDFFSDTSFNLTRANLEISNAHRNQCLRDLEEGLFGNISQGRAISTLMCGLRQDLIARMEAVGCRVDIDACEPGQFQELESFIPPPDTFEWGAARIFQAEKVEPADAIVDRATYLAEAINALWLEIFGLENEGHAFLTKQVPEEPTIYLLPPPLLVSAIASVSQEKGLEIKVVLPAERPAKKDPKKHFDTKRKHLAKGLPWLEMSLNHLKGFPPYITILNQLLGILFFLKVPQLRQDLVALDRCLCNLPALVRKKEISHRLRAIILEGPQEGDLDKPFDTLFEQIHSQLQGLQEKGTYGRSIFKHFIVDFYHDLQERFQDRDDILEAYDRALYKPWIGDPKPI